MSIGASVLIGYLVKSLGNYLDFSTTYTLNIILILIAIVQPLGILHPNTSLKDQWWDERDFAVIDPDNNLISFFQQIKS